MKYLLTFLLACTACAAPRTTQLHIMYDGEDAFAVANVTPMQRQIDAAAVAASLMVGLDPDKVRFDTWIVMFHAGPIEWQNKLYAGLSVSGYSRVMYTPKCLFAPESALLHEFVHQTLGLRYGDMDAEHRGAIWGLIDIAKTMLRDEFCSGYVADFMPEGIDLPRYH